MLNEITGKDDAERFVEAMGALSQRRGPQEPYDAAKDVRRMEGVRPLRSLRTPCTWTPSTWTRCR